MSSSEKGEPSSSMHVTNVAGLRSLLYIRSRLRGPDQAPSVTAATFDALSLCPPPREGFRTLPAYVAKRIPFRR